MASKCHVKAEVTAKRKVMSKQRSKGGKPTQRKGGKWPWLTPIVKEDSVLSDLVRFSATLYFLSLDVQSLPLYIFKYAPFYLVWNGMLFLAIKGPFKQLLLFFNVSGSI